MSCTPPVHVLCEKLGYPVLHTCGTHVLCCSIHVTRTTFMYVHMYVCAQQYIHTCAHKYTYMYVYMCTCMYVQQYCTFMLNYMNVRYMQYSTYMTWYIHELHIHSCTYIHSYIHTCLNTHTCTYMYTSCTCMLPAVIDQRSKQQYYRYYLQVDYSTRVHVCVLRIQQYKLLKVLHVAHTYVMYSTVLVYQYQYLYQYVQGTSTVHTRLC